MNIWRLRTPRQWWNGHHWKYANQPFSPTTDRDCRRCRKWQRARLAVGTEIWFWQTLDKGDTVKVCNRTKGATMNQQSSPCSLEDDSGAHPKDIIFTDTDFQMSEADYCPKCGEKL